MLRSLVSELSVSEEVRTWMQGGPTYFNLELHAQELRKALEKISGRRNYERRNYTRNTLSLSPSERAEIERSNRLALPNPSPPPIYSTPRRSRGSSILDKSTSNSPRSEFDVNTRPADSPTWSESSQFARYPDWWRNAQDPMIRSLMNRQQDQGESAVASDNNEELLERGDGLSMNRIRQSLRKVGHQVTAYCTGGFKNTNNPSCETIDQTPYAVIRPTHQGNIEPDSRVSSWKSWLREQKGHAGKRLRTAFGTVVGAKNAERR